jgi:hypothetical protein
MNSYQTLLLVKVLSEVLTVGEDFAEHQGPPLPPETLGFRRIEGATARPDYPPSTCCVRVVRLGCCWSNLYGQMIRGQGRANLGSDVQRWKFSGVKTGRNR